MKQWTNQIHYTQFDHELFGGVTQRRFLHYMEGIPLEERRE